MSGASLRLGSIAKVYYDIKGETLPKQLDLLDAWFPGLIVTVDPSDDRTKVPARYVEREFRIHAVRRRGKLYSGSSGQISQICGRLTGTAEGNREKERKNAELIQKHVAECFVKDMDLTPALKENAMRQISDLTDDQTGLLYQALLDLVYDLAENRRAADEYDLRTELFAMDDETFDGVIYNAAYQLQLETVQGLSNAFLWLLTGGLLRNEAGRVLRLYDSSFIAVRRQSSETGELTDKLNYLFHPETYYYVFEGDDLGNRFPGVEWYCDGCGAHLNDFEGFDDHMHSWKCPVCGHVNTIDISEVYENDEDCNNRIRPVDPQAFADAVRRRREELGGGD